MKYPETKKGDVVDDYHGTKVADPYRWLEDDVRKSKDVADWVEAQNKVTIALPRSDPRARGDQEAASPTCGTTRSISAPFKDGGRYFFTKNDGLQNQTVLTCRTRSTASRACCSTRTRWSKDGTVALAGLVGQRRRQVRSPTASPRPGRDWNDVEGPRRRTGKTLDDELKWVKFSGASWTKDGKGFFYSRFPEPKKGADVPEPERQQKLYYHRLGTPQSDDVLVYERPDQPKWGVGGDVTEDGRTSSSPSATAPPAARSASSTRTSPSRYGKPVELDRQLRQRVSTSSTTTAPVFYFQTDYNAPQGPGHRHRHRRNPDKKNWKDDHPRGEGRRSKASSLVGNQFVAQLPEGRARRR